MKKQLRAINKIAKGEGRDSQAASRRLPDALGLGRSDSGPGAGVVDPAMISIAPGAAASRINMSRRIVVTLT